MLNDMDFNLFKNQVRFKIALELIDIDQGLSIRQLNELLKDVPQSTLYRQVSFMMGDNLLKVVGFQKVGKVEEKFYALNTEGYKINAEDWNSASYSEKIDFVSFYFMYILQNYKNYYEKSKTEDQQDQSTFSLVKFNLSDESFKNFQGELSTLLEKYYNLSDEDDNKDRTISVVIIP